MSPTDRAAMAATLVASMLLGLGFVLALGRPWLAPRELRTQAWLQLALAAVPVALDLLLLLVVARVPPPLWVIIAVLLGQDIVYAGRLVVLFRERQERNRS